MARLSLGLGIALALCCVVQVRATDIDQLQREVARIREEIARQDHPKLASMNGVDGVIVDRFGDNLAVTSRNGRITFGGLVQVWYQSFQKDHYGIVKPAPGNNLDPTPGSAIPPEIESVLDNDTFRVRRTELRMSVDVTDNITGYIMMDPARESNVTFTPIPTFPNHNAVFTNPHLANGTGQQSGNSIIPQVLQDAYINYSGVVPHTDFTIGQFKPPSGEEAWRNSGQLDFVDRSMVTAINNVRDLGVMAHGSWFYTNPDNPSTGRFQYWVGGFNGPESVLIDPEIFESGNRADDNNDKDLAWRVAARPVWDTKAWKGRLEMGYARTDGYRGSSGQGFDLNKAINSLNRERTKVNRQGAWVWYRPNGEVKGWWFRGEWGSGHDRYSVRASTTLLGAGQLDPKPVTAQGWYFATGYRLSDSRFAESLSKASPVVAALRNVEFAFRYEAYQNIAAESLTNPIRNTDLFQTAAYTAGVNYYIKNYDARLQANYIVVEDPTGGNPNRGLRAVRNNVFVVSFQVMW